jgi:polyhydroxyalkanoate synthase
MSTENRIETPSSDGISEQASRSTLALNPLVGISGQDLFDSAGILFKAIVNEPKAATEQWLSLLGELGAIAGGKSERMPKTGDKRFSDSTWKESGLHSGLLKAYLAWGEAVGGLVDKTGLGDADKARASGHGNPDRCGGADQCDTH